METAILSLLDECVFNMEIMQHHRFHQNQKIFIIRKRDSDPFMAQVFSNYIKLVNPCFPIRFAIAMDLQL